MPRTELTVTPSLPGAELDQPSLALSISLNVIGLMLEPFKVLSSGVGASVVRGFSRIPLYRSSTFCRLGRVGLILTERPSKICSARDFLFFWKRSCTFLYWLVLLLPCRLGAPYCLGGLLGRCLGCRLHAGCHWSNSCCKMSVESVTAASIIFLKMSSPRVSSWSAVSASLMARP